MRMYMRMYGNKKTSSDIVSYVSVTRRAYAETSIIRFIFTRETVVEVPRFICRLRECAKAPTVPLKNFPLSCSSPLPNETVKKVLLIHQKVSFITLTISLASNFILDLWSGWSLPRDPPSLLQPCKSIYLFINSVQIHGGVRSRSNSEIETSHLMLALPWRKRQIDWNLTRLI